MDDFFVAVLVQLSEEHEAMVGIRFLEAGFGLPNTVTPSMFANLDAAQAWIIKRLLFQG
ncbi:hypothetical protein ACRBEV_32490 [Methylobacterium phyllosphaerae]